MRASRQAARLLLGVVIGVMPVALPAAASAVRLDELPQRWTDDDGREVRLTQLEGHRVILTMAYASCHRICPATIAALRSMQKKLDGRGEAAEFVVIGYDPANDDAAVWRRYRARHHLARSNWHFLSGPRDATQILARQLGFEFWTYDDHVMHGSRALIFDAHGALQSVLGPDSPDWAGTL